MSAEEIIAEENKVILICKGLRFYTDELLMVYEIRSKGDQFGESSMYKGKYRDTNLLLKCFEVEQTEKGFRVITQLSEKDSKEYALPIEQELECRAHQLKAIELYRKFNRKKAPVTLEDQYLQALHPFRLAYQNAKNPTERRIVMEYLEDLLSKKS